MLNFGNKEFRNLQEQVLKNMSDIQDIMEGTTVLADFGIKVVGRVESIDELPDPATYEGDYGDAYIVGTGEPYSYYIFTRAFEGQEDPSWFNLGVFPKPGPQGPKGDKGDTGEAATMSVGTVTTTTLSPGQQAHVAINSSGTSSNKVISFVFDIPQGAQGIQGQKGDTGATGAQGLQGIQGEKGDPGNLYTILGQVNSALDLPDPSDVTRTGAYLVGASEPYDVYVIIGTGSFLEWINLGPIATTSMPTHVLTMDYSESGTAAATTLQDINNESGAHFVQVGNNVFVFGDRSGIYNHYYALGSNGPEVEEAELILNTSNGSWNIVVTDLARTDGEYLRMKVGLADNLTTSIDNNESAAFTFRSSGGDADIGTGASTINYLYGNSVAFNQLAIVPTISSRTTSGVTITNNNNGSVTLSGTATDQITFDLSGNLQRNIPLGHKVMITNFKTPSNTTYYLYDAYEANLSYALSSTPYGYIKTKEGSSTIISPRIRIENGATINETIWVMYFDLTQMFGAGNEPETVEEFNRLFSNPYYAYNAGTLMSCQSSAYKTVGYNACSGVFTIVGGNSLRSAVIKAIPGQTYVFEKPDFTDYQYRHFCVVTADGTLIREVARNINTDGAQELTLGADEHYLQVRYWYYESNHYTSVPSPETLNTCVHLKWSGSKTGYEDYVSYTYNLPNIELRSAGSAFDELRPDGTLIRRIGVYTFTGNETGNQINTATDGGGAQWTRYAIHIAINPTPHTNKILNNFGLGTFIGADTGSGSVGYIIDLRPNDMYIIVKSSDFVDVNALISYLAGKTIYFELAEPTTTNVGSTFSANTYINDWGTQEFISDQTIQIPQGLSMMYNLGLRDFLQRLYIRTEGDAPSVAIGPDIPNPPSSGTYVLKSVDGVISWVAE